MYHVLPSQVEEQATTFDLMVTDVYAAWEKYRQNPSDQSQYNEDSLTEFFEASRRL